MRRRRRVHVMHISHSPDTRLSTPIAWLKNCRDEVDFSSQTLQMSVTCSIETANRYCLDGASQTRRRYVGVYLSDVEYRIAAQTGIQYCRAVSGGGVDILFGNPRQKSERQK